MATIAEQLGVTPQGLYRYAKSIANLRALVLDKVTRMASWPSIEQPWQDQLTGIGEAFLALCDTYPGYATGAIGTKHVSASRVEAMTPHIGSMHAQGFDTVDACAAVEFVANVALLSSLADDRGRRLQERSVGPERTIDVPDDAGMRTSRSWYQQHLEVYLDGLQARLAQRGV